MQDKKEQFEILSRELLGKIADVTVNSDLFFPFGYVLPKEIEEKYFYEGLLLRSLTIRHMIIIDNSFKKFQLYPSHDVMVTYIETQKDLLSGWAIEAVEEFNKMVEHLKGHEGEGKLDPDDFRKVIDKIQSDINKASMAAIKEVASSEEAKALDMEHKDTAGGFVDFIHSTISGLFK